MSTPYDSNLEDEDAEQLVTTTDEGVSETVNDLPLDKDDDKSSMEDPEEYDQFGYMSKSAEDLFEEEGAEDDAGSETIEYLKRPPAGPTIDDFLEPDEATERDPIDIQGLGSLTRPEAEKIAEEVITVLEEDLAEYVARTGITFPEPLTKTELKRLKIGLQEGDSASSFNSELSDILPGEPSRVRMTYEKGTSIFADLSLTNLLTDEMVDKEVQVNLHRVKKKKAVRKVDGFSQSLEMTFIPADNALLIFKQLYPQVDDFKVKEPASRQASQELAIKKAQEADPDIDNKRKGPDIISLSNKKQLLQQLMDNYYKEEKLWTGSKFMGQFLSRQFFKGKYEHPTGTTIESEFLNGHFHTQKHLGLVSYPRGDTFEGEWTEGRYQTGQITFCDGLKFSGSDWKYCEPPDRRFKVERYYGIKPAGKTLFCDQNPPPYVPPGMYDVGDGYYNPKNGDIRGYDGFLQRRANRTEGRWVEGNCRKVHDTMEQIGPKFLSERIPGSYCEAQKRIPLTKKRYH